MAIAVEIGRYSQQAHVGPGKLRKGKKRPFDFVVGKDFGGFVQVFPEAQAEKLVI